MDTPPTPDPYGTLAYFWRSLCYGGPVNLLGWAAVAAVIIWSTIAVVRSAYLRKRLPRDRFLPFAHVSYLLFLGCVGVGGQFFAVNHPDPVIYALILGEHLVLVGAGSVLVLLSCAVTIAITRPTSTPAPFGAVGIVAALLSLMIQMGTTLIAVALMT